MPQSGCAVRAAHGGRKATAPRGAASLWRQRTAPPRSRPVDPATRLCRAEPPVDAASGCATRNHPWMPQSGCATRSPLVEAPTHRTPRSHLVEAATHCAAAEPPRSRGRLDARESNAPPLERRDLPGEPKRHSTMDRTPFDSTGGTRRRRYRAASDAPHVTHQPTKPGIFQQPPGTNQSCQPRPSNSRSASPSSGVSAITASSAPSSGDGDAVAGR
jgi:hypothetical protein